MTLLLQHSLDLASALAWTRRSGVWLVAWWVGGLVGCLVGWWVCLLVGWWVGWWVGSFVCWLLGWLVAWWVGGFVCLLVGWLVGCLVGWWVCLFVGWLVGWLLGGLVGLFVCWLVGCWVGWFVCWLVGLSFWFVGCLRKGTPAGRKLQPRTSAYLLPILKSLHQAGSICSKRCQTRSTRAAAVLAPKFQDKFSGDLLMLIVSSTSLTPVFFVGCWPPENNVYGTNWQCKTCKELFLGDVRRRKKHSLIFRSHNDLHDHFWKTFRPTVAKNTGFRRNLHAALSLIGSARHARSFFFRQVISISNLLRHPRWVVSQIRPQWTPSS